MRAMILAAGRGERLRPLTDTCPKPLIKVGGKELLVWHIERLRQAGISEIIVNSAWLSSMIVDFLGDGARFGVHIEHSVEEPGGLETAGGIIKALPFFEGRDFLVVNGDTYMDTDYREFIKTPLEGALARLFLTVNPPHNQKGDFAVSADHKLIKGSSYTFSGAALYSCRAFEGYGVQRLALRPFFERWIEKKEALAEILTGQWFDAGTVERLKIIEDYIKAS